MRRSGPLLRILCLAGLILLAGVALAGATEPASPGLRFMLEEIRRDARETAPWTGRSEISESVMGAMTRVPREAFVPTESAHLAYYNFPLGIGHGQTISAPFIVALMTDLLRLSPSDRVLEIGTGSGYQAAVLDELVEQVYTIEIVPELAESAARALARTGYQDIQVRTGDGWYGWPEQAPFDAIIVTAVAEEPPPQLLQQLAPGGRMVLPLGPANGAQMLAVLEKDRAGAVSRRDVLPVAFVPLTGGH